MKSQRIIILITYLLIFISSCSHSGNQNHQKYCDDNLKCMDGEHLYIGEINKRESDLVKPFSFKLENTGTDTITISDVEVACNCVTVEKYTDIISPDENGIVTGTINLSNQHGHISKAIFINYNDNNVLTLRIIGDIIE